MNTYSRWSVASCLWLISLLLGFSSAQALAGQLAPPQQVIQDTSEKLREVLQTETLKRDFNQANRIVRDVFDPHVDFNRISALVLGKYWKRASSEEKKRFKEEFRTLLIRTYATALTEFQDWKVNYLPLRMSPKDRKVIVRTEVLQAGRPPVAVNYRMAEKNGDWKAYDVIVEGISLVTNYRSSFKTEIERSGSLTSVIEQLVARNHKAGSRS